MCERISTGLTQNVFYLMGVLFDDLRSEALVLQEKGEPEGTAEEKVEGDTAWKG